MALISGWIAEEPSRRQEECFEFAHKEALDDIGRRLSHFMPGEKHQGLRYQASLRNESIDLVLAPVWLLTVAYDPQKPPFQVLVNGQNGRVWGKAPVAWWKVACLVSACAIPVLFFMNTPLPIRCY